MYFANRSYLQGSFLKVALKAPANEKTKVFLSVFSAISTHTQRSHVVCCYFTLSGWDAKSHDYARIQIPIHLIKCASFVLTSYENFY